MTHPSALPEEVCEWCGAVVKYVRVLPAGQWTDGALSVPIDADPLAWDDPEGRLVRVPRGRVGGRIDCAMPVREETRWMHERTYRYHRDSCPNRHMWTGVKKWVRTVRERDAEREMDPTNPEIAAAMARGHSPFAPVAPPRTRW